MGFSFQPPLIDQASRFQPNQIVCLEDKDSRLYAEVVQVVVARRVCWARPLMLATNLLLENQSHSSPGSEALSDNSTLLDLRQSSDLLLPEVLFRSALDTEVIPLLTQLQMLKTFAEELAVRSAHQQMNQFIRQLCQAYPEAF